MKRVIVTGTNLQSRVTKYLEVKDGEDEGKLLSRLKETYPYAFAADAPACSSQFWIADYDTLRIDTVRLNAQLEKEKREVAEKELTVPISKLVETLICKGFITKEDLI